MVNAGGARDACSISGSGRSPGGGNGNVLQYPCLENLVDRSRAGYSPWCHKELDTTKCTHAHTHIAGTSLSTIQVPDIVRGNLEAKNG